MEKRRGVIGIKCICREKKNNYEYTISYNILQCRPSVYVSEADDDGRFNSKPRRAETAGYHHQYERIYSRDYYLISGSSLYVGSLKCSRKWSVDRGDRFRTAADQFVLIYCSRARRRDIDQAAATPRRRFRCELTAVADGQKKKKKIQDSGNAF